MRVLTIICRQNKWYLDCSCLDSGSGAEIECSEKTAREIINEFGFVLDEGEVEGRTQYWWYK